MTPQTRTGLIAGLGAYLMWGLLPLYLKLLTGIPAADVLANRILWSLLLIGAIMLATGGLPRLRAVMATPRLLLLLLASAVLIAINWLIYTWAILNGHVLDTSLGYFINPLISIVFGVVLLGERLAPAQWLAVALAGLGVAIIAFANGALPLISLGVALSFALYGLVRKYAAVDAVTGLLVETVILAPVALGWLLTRPDGLLGRPLATEALLIAGGALTAVPLLLFGVATRWLKLSTIGLMQYIAPTMVFLLAVFLFGELLTPSRLLAFGCIWTGLAIYTRSVLQAGRRA
ncbi:MAG: chloramphenicol resistance permease RarD [Pseudomonadota bacterium]